MVQCAFKDSMTRKACNSHYLSHFAAFFIDARAKRSIVKSCTFSMILLSLRKAAFKEVNYSYCVLQLSMSITVHNCATIRSKQVAVELSTIQMILPQVHLRKPCYDFYFL